MSSKLLRVTQLDATQLDNEIEKILKSCVDNSTRFLPLGLTVPYEPEINLLIKLLILNYSILKNNSTFGQTLLLIKYNNLTNVKKLFYIILSCVTYIKERFELSQPSHKINKYFNTIDLLTKLCTFVNLSIFLRTGSKPSLTDRILNLEQIYARNYVPRHFGDKYLTRELVWNGFIELLVFVIPLINYHKIKRIARDLFLTKTKSKISVNVQRVYNTQTKCPHCLRSPINPHHMGCAHIFCYVCLKSNQLADPKYECPLCGNTSIMCERIVVI